MPALTQQEGEQRVRDLTSYILGAANEEADEIHLKADQDGRQEKSRIVEEAKVQIKKDMEKRNARLSSEDKINAAKAISAARIEVLCVQANELKTVLAEVTKHVETLSQDKKSYVNLLAGLISQGIAKMRETKCVIKCRKQDLQQVEEAIPMAKKQFVEAHGKKGASVDDLDIQVLRGESDFLSETYGFDGLKMAGGIILLSQNRKIAVDNTLNARVEIAAEQLLPQIKASLWDDSQKALKQLGKF